MACPNTEDGFVMIAVELGSALAMVDLTKGERLVVWEVVTQMYGKAKLTEARVSPADVAARTNTERAMISKAVRSLVESNILTAGREDQTYRLQKDYEKWTRVARKEDAETAEARVSYAVEAVARSNGRVPKVRPGRPKAAPEMRVSTDTDYPETRVSTDTNYGEMRVSTDTVSVSLQTRERVSTDTPILLEEFRDLRETPPSPPQGGETTTAEASPESKTEDAPATVAFPDLRANHRVASGGHQVDEAELLRAAAFIEREFVEKGRDYAFTCELYRVSEQYPTDWFLKALINARVQEKRSGELIKRFTYITNTLDRWVAHRGPIPGDWCDYDETLNLRDPEKHKAALRMKQRTAAYRPAAEVKPVPLPPEFKAPADWDQPGTPNPFSKHRRPESA